MSPIAVSETNGSRFRPLPFALVCALALAVALARPWIALEPRAHATLVVLVVAAGLWMTESLPVAVTALLIPVLGTVLGVFPAKQAFAGFGDPIVFLFLGTFLLADAAQVHGLNARLARAVLSSRAVMLDPRRLLWAIGFLGVAISAWVNNTATTALLLPLALTAERLGSPRLLTGILLMTAWGPSLGGLATPVGTAPNLIGLRLLEQATGSRPSFAAWTALFAPLAIVVAAIAAAWLWWRSGPAPSALAVEPLAVEPERRPWSRAERTLLPLFAVVVLLWITPGVLAATTLAGEPWVATWQARLPEAAVPMLGALLLFALPAGGGRRILGADALGRLDWGTLMLFGGGLSLGAMMFDSGLAAALGEAIFRVVPVPGTFGIVLAATLMGVIVSEMTSNTASASLVVPVVLALAHAAGVDPVKPALAATAACSFGFMLPVSTPPNALVYGTGRLGMRAMIANGIVLDVIGVIVLTAWVTWLG